MNGSATRYVKTINENPEMAHNKIVSRVNERSNVLEIGPASGSMTRVLKEKSHCKVSIVEIDKECFDNAKKYAVDGICTDVEKLEWIEHFNEKSFDYILFVDVLEHLRNSEEVLIGVKKLLKDEGSILISVPNIAHNSVILQLLKNEIVYQNTGLLDYSHVHWFTFSEVSRLIGNAGYGPVYMDATYISVGKNEFNETYAEVELPIEKLLKERPFGEVYQHIWEIKKKEYLSCNDVEIENCLDDTIDYETLKQNEGLVDYDTVNNEIVSKIAQKPNHYFKMNSEIARLRMMINQMYDNDETLNNVSLLNEKIFEIQNELYRRGRHICELDEQIEEKNSYISSLRDENNEFEEKLKWFVENDKQQIETISQQANIIKNNIEELRIKESFIVDLEKQLERKETEICNRDGHIEQLLEVEREYEREKQTRAYRFGKKLQKVSQFFFPLNSKRRFIAKFMVKMIKHPIQTAKLITPKRIGKFFTISKNEGMAETYRRFDDLERKTSIMNQQVADVKIEKASVEATAKDINDIPKLILPEYDNPKVSIVIPVYNEFDYTYACIKSIIQNTRNVSYEVIIANDCSTDITVEIEKIVKNIRLITTEENCRFLLNCNNAAKYVKGEYIFFLNNDTQVQDNWLKPLIDLIESDDKIGMVGSKLVYPDGRLQEAGGILWKDGSAWNFGSCQNPEASEFNYVKEVDYISGAAIMIRRTLWEEIGGFDETFVPAYCEDSDLAFEVRKHGYKLMYQPLSVVVHFEGVSNGTDTNSGQKSYQIVNQKKFMEKWKNVLEKEHFPNGENVFVARDRNKDKPVILMVDHYVPQYDKDAGSRTVYQYLQLFVSMGYNVKFIGDNFFRHEPYTTDLQQLGIEVLYGKYYADHWQDWIRDNGRFIQYVFLNRPHISEKYIDFIRKNTDAKIMYYGHDLHFLREMREYELTGDSSKLDSSNEWKKKELELMRKADVVYYPSYVEVEEIKKVAPDISAKAIVAYMFRNVEVEEYIYDKRTDIMFVGGYGHPPNIDAIKWFVGEILPDIIAKIPKLKLHIIGSKPPSEIEALASQNVIIEGFVTDEQLEEFYKTCRMAVVPLRYGAGIKGKVVEAMRYGIPVVTTSVGAEGIQGAEDILKISDEKETMVQSIISLYENEMILKKMAKDSINYIQNNFAEANAWSVIKEDFQ